MSLRRKYRTHLSQSPGHQTLNNGTSVVMQEMDFINDQQLHKLG